MSSAMRFFGTSLVICLLVATSIAVWQYAIDDSAEGREEPAPKGSARELVPWSVQDASAVLPEGVKFIYKEFTPTADKVWLALADDPAQRFELATIDHAPGAVSKATLAADGRYLAYVVVSRLPGGSQLWTVDLEKAESRLLAQEVNVRIAPGWSPNASAIVFARETEAGKALVQVNTDGSSEAVIVESDVPGLYPIGYSSDGSSFYYAQLTAAGTDFGVVSLANGDASIFAHASDYVARDWRLSPDGTSIVYLAPQFADGRVHYRAMTLPVTGGRPVAVALAFEGGRDHLSFAWHPNGRDITLGQTPGASGIEVLSLASGDRVATVGVPSSGVTAPVAWSSDGGYLAVRSFEGNELANLGRETGIIVTADGKRREIPAEGKVDFIGWLSQ